MNLLLTIDACQIGGATEEAGKENADRPALAAAHTRVTIPHARKLAVMGIYCVRDCTKKPTPAHGGVLAGRQ